MRSLREEWPINRTFAILEKPGEAEKGSAGEQPFKE
jgi:hypothetical protein